MWMVEDLTRIVQEMLLEGNLHNIVVFTVITSSSVLSVVGALKHIYTFIHRVRHGQRVDPPPVRQPYTNSERSDPPLVDDYLSVGDSIDRIAVISCQAVKRNVKDRREYEGSLMHRRKRMISSPTCLKCSGGKWERYCMYGLCQACCERLGGCQTQGHQQRPLAYNPWSKSNGRSERIIDLSHLCLSELPPRLGFHHMDAYSLDLSYNFLTHLPDHVTLMRGLVCVNLRHNLMSFIPPFFANLHQLSFIDLRNNKISTFPESLLQLPLLLKLHLDNNYLSELPCDFDQLHSLQCLTLGHNKLTAIPDSLFNIRGLKVLCLRGNPTLSTLPNSVGNLICLQKLDVSRCDLLFIPQAIGSCSVLRKFSVANNRLSHLPCEISQCYRLEYLDVSNNRVTHLPATLLYKQGLLMLKADGNQFIKKLDPNSVWSVLDKVWLENPRHVPTLRSLARAVVEICQLNTDTLPMPIQDELSSNPNCYHCGKKNAISHIRAVKFSRFGQLQHQYQEYPFLYTFCFEHFQGCGLDTVEVCLDALSYAQDSDKAG